MKFKFLVTSAINSRFGKFSKEERMEQTKSTINSINQYAPGSDIVLIDMCGDPVTKEQQEEIRKTGISGMVIYDNPEIREIYKIESQDIVKNVTEVKCFGAFLNENDFVGYDRVFKMSGRYQLNGWFKPEDYSTYLNDHITFSGLYNSQFPPQVTGNPPEDNFQYMSRLWSFNPSLHLDTVRDAYQKMIYIMVQRINAGGYIDIEHCLYRFMPKIEIAMKTPSGLSGGIAPNGYIVND